MAPLAALALALPLLAAPAPARKPTLPPTPPDVAMKMSSLFAKATPAVRSWVDAEARKLRQMPRVDLAAVAADARQRFASAAAPLTPAQADVLAAMALYQTAKDLESAFVTWEKASERKDALGDKKDALAEMSAQDALQLQQMMEKKSQLEALISNVVRTSYDAGQGAAVLKAS